MFLNKGLDIIGRILGLGMVEDNLMMMIINQDKFNRKNKKVKKELN